MAKAFAKGFYNSKAWERCRDAYAKSAGNLCEDCLEAGVYTPGRIVHHLVELTPDNIGDANITLGWDNLRLVCYDCHIKRHSERGSVRYRFDAEGHILPPVEKNNGASGDR